MEGSTKHHVCLDRELSCLQNVASIQPGLPKVQMPVKNFLVLASKIL